VEVVASLSQGRTFAAQCGLFTHKSVPVIFEPPCIYDISHLRVNLHPTCSGPCADAVSEQPFEPAPFTDLISARTGNSVHHYVVTYLCFRSKPQDGDQSCSRNVE